MESVNLGLELRKRVTHNFSTLRARSLEYKQQLISQVCKPSISNNVKKKMSKQKSTCQLSPIPTTPSLYK